ncbi:MAG: type II toxin-antitoxin system VapC family toxin [Chromatiales bacterium]|nr:type II toxin-antitoxin system VapC family toxin [Gammaproteobacteria bacterium]MBW6476521.1 type II toxin-antitoxin system VapC family toxin [Chromatiales bacterium]
MRFVLDNSVVMRWLFGDGSDADNAYAQAVLQAMTDPHTTALVPSVWPLEMANLLTKAESKGLLSEARSSAFVGVIQRMAIRVVPGTASHALGDTLQLARRFKLSSYDAAYLELALREGVPLATLDKELKRAAKKTGVELFG